MKRRILVILFLLLGSFFVSSTVFSANTDIVITEIGAYESSGHEWVEVWNKGAESVDMADWKFWENNTNHSLSVSTTDFILGAGEYGVIVQDADQFILDYPFFSGSVFDSSWSSLNESGEEIGLKDSGGNVIEQFSYVAAPDFSLQRIDPFLAEYTTANWVQHVASNTIGFVNNFTTVPTSTVSTTPTSPPQGGATTSTTSTVDSAPTSSPTTTTTNSESGGNQNNTTSNNNPIVQSIQNLAPIKINELVADPGDANEWIELYNTSPASIDITGAMLCDNRNTTSTCKKLTGLVVANGWLQTDLQTKSFLNNSGDSVMLKDTSGIVIDRIDYEEDMVPDQGQSLARKADGVDTDSDTDWVVTDTVTPGTANIVAAVINSSTAIAPTSTATPTAANPGSVFVWSALAPSSADINEVVTISVDGTADPRGGTLSFLWTLENGQQVQGPEIKTSFTASGVHTVSVLVSSTSGYSEEKKIEIMVGAGLSLQADIIISELLPNPDGEDSGEFVELKNNSARPANISGWFLKVGEKNYVLPENTIIAANGFLTFYKVATKLSLVNTLGTVELLNKDKIAVDVVSYEKPASGKSYTVLGGQWHWADPSPGKEAVISAAESEGIVAGERIFNTTDKKTTSLSVAGPLVTSITEARAAAKGQTAKLQGIVTAVPDVFGSQFVYIMGDNGGIQIYQSKKDFPPLGIGDLVEITGTVSEASGIKRINIKNSEAVDILSLGNALEAVPLPLGEINDENAGALVQVEGEITEIKSTFMYIDDGAGEIKIYFKKNAKIDKKLLKEGGQVQVTGILEKTSSEWQVWPRSMDDVENTQPEPALGEVLGEKIETPIQQNPVNKYLIATSIGLAGLLLALLARAALKKAKG